MVLVTGVSWDLSSPESNSNYGVGDTHNQQWETVHQDDDNNVVPAEKYTHILENLLEQNIWDFEFVEL